MDRARILDLTPNTLRLRLGNEVVHRTELALPDARPVLKWPGGKQWLAPAAKHLTPPNWSGRYFEPFFGGGAFYFSLQPNQAVLVDRNADLITTYLAIRDKPDEVIRLLRRYPYDEAFYYEMRETAPRSPVRIAARLLYLSRTCWNGLYRVNQKGEFNTPFGQFGNPSICPEDRIRRVSAVLSDAVLRSADFTVVTGASEGDFAYLDPPYITGHWKNGFLKYNAHLFSWQDQRRLARTVLGLMHRGVHVLVSNADHPSVTKLYAGLFRYRVRRRSLISGSPDSRGIINEILLSSYPLLGIKSEIL